jgi:ABC-type multidrug transport system ATPase subunit
VKAPGRAHLSVIAGLPWRVFALETTPVLIGRSAKADFQLNHLEVSRRHCRAALEGDVWMLQDLTSRWGTKINDTPVPAATALQPGDRVSLGPVVLLFGEGEPVAAESLVEKPWIPVLVKGLAATRIPLGEHVTMGRDEESGILLADPSVSRRHALIRKERDGFRVIDLHSLCGSFVNGRRFDEHLLTIGDRLSIGQFYFQFDGLDLNRIENVSGSTVHALQLLKNSGTAEILKGITLTVAPCRFAGILGPSGAGKSSLLDALSGLKPPTSGHVFIDGVDIHSQHEPVASGYVPQEDLVHEALTVWEALRFSAQLRLPQTTPPAEIEKLIAQTVAQLGLGERASTPISRLSGGQRKRVSVAVELLARPALLFLDEPTSGLDPAMEFKLMELLRGLADTGCTIVCTTHVMDHVYLMDRIAVLCGGRLVFDAPPREAPEYFGVRRMAELYDRLEERRPEEWESDFRKAFERGLEKPAAKPVPPRPRVQRAPGALFALGVLIRRQYAILVADWRNIAILLAQPVLIAALVSWVSRDAPLELFFAYIATLWFGCSNAAQEIVSEIPIYRRERIVGVERGTYLASKFLFLAAATVLQALTLYACLQAGARGLPGAVMWQAASLCGIAFAAVGMGLAISALARSATQAVFVVPIALIPLILFSGYTVPASNMKPSVLAFSRLTPTFASQVLMDSSLLWHKRMAGEVVSDYYSSFRNLDRDHMLHTGDVFTESRPLALALLTEAAWALGGCFAAFLGLRGHEKRS